MGKIWVQKPPLGSQVNWGHPLSKDLVGCWLMNEGGGLTLNDLAYHNSAQMFSGLSWVPSEKGKAINDDASANGYASVTGATKYTIATGSFTVSCWCKTTTTTRMGILDRREAGKSSGYILGMNTTGIALFGLWSTSTASFSVSTTTTYADGKWHHFVGVRDSVRKLQSIYVDGRLATAPVDSTGWETIFSTGSGVLSIGAGNINVTASSWVKFNGQLSLACIWERVLTPDAISSLHANPYQFIQRPSYRILGQGAGGFKNIDSVPWADIKTIHGRPTSEIKTIHGVPTT